MTRTVSDFATAMEVLVSGRALVSRWPRLIGLLACVRQVTKNFSAYGPQNYRAYLKKDGLKGVRLGYIVSRFLLNDSTPPSYSEPCVHCVGRLTFWRTRRCRFRARTTKSPKCSRAFHLVLLPCLHALLC